MKKIYFITAFLLSALNGFCQDSKCSYCNQLREENYNQYKTECIQKDSVLENEVYKIHTTFQCDKDHYSFRRLKDKDPFLSYQVTKAGDTLFTRSENEPEFNGGNEAMIRFLQKTLVYPLQAERDNIEGRVVLSFVISKTGSITDVKIYKSVHPLLDAEAVRVIRLMPDWIPGKYNGIPQKFIRTIPIKFSIPEPKRKSR